MQRITPSPDGAQASADTQVTPSPNAEAGGQSQQAAAPVTRDDLKAAVREGLTELAREQQSQRDKLEARIQKQFQTVLAAAKAGGVDLTAEQQTKARETIASAVYQEELQPPSEEEGRPAKPPADAGTIQEPNQPAESTSPLTELANRIMDLEGIDIDENDPEAKAVNWSDEKTLYSTLTAAMAEKRRRTAVARSPLSGGRPSDNPIADIKDPDELWRLSRQKR